MDIRKGDRAEAIKALINIWLKAPGLSCANCGQEHVDYKQCCEFPVIADNWGQMKKFLEELKVIKETRKNSYASDEKKTMRFGVSIPANLYKYLDDSMQELYQERLFTKEYDVIWFAKKFPQFKVPERI